MPRRESRRPIAVPRGALASGFELIEHALNAAIAVTLALAGGALFVNILVRFARDVDRGPFVGAILGLLDGLILVFIMTELLHTLRAVIIQNALTTEPFLVVGIVAIVRRLIVISAEGSGVLGTPRFDDLMLEMGVLLGGLLALGVVLYLLRHTEHSEPSVARADEGA